MNYKRLSLLVQLVHCLILIVVLTLFSANSSINDIVSITMLILSSLILLATNFYIEMAKCNDDDQNWLFVFVMLLGFGFFTSALVSLINECANGCFSSMKPLYIISVIYFFICSMILVFGFVLIMFEESLKS